MLHFIRTWQNTNGDERTTSREIVVCPKCGEDARFLLASTDRNRHTTDAVFEYFECMACRLVFMDPIPSDLRPFYAGGYLEIPQTLGELSVIARREAYRMKPVLQSKSGGRLLEIGPWMGVFSYNAKLAGFDVSAIEMDETCVDFLKKVVGVRAFQSADPAAMLATMDEEFDVIALWHCLEHLLDPWTVIRNAARRLAPGGVLLIAIPNIESYEFELLHAAWRNLDAPRHLYFFPIPSLMKLAAECGLIKRSLTTNDELSEAFSLETWTRLSDAWAAGSTWHSRFMRAIKPIPWRVMKRLANWHERRHEAGSGITVVFERPL